MKAVVLAILILVTSALAGDLPVGRETDERGAIVADTSLVFGLVAGHRLYPEWSEEHEVRLGEEFWLGDLDFRGVIRCFMSDFKIIDGERVNASPAMENPSVFVVVLGDSGAVDSTWAFLNFPPHFSPNNFFTFQLTRVDGYEPPAEGEED